MAEIVFVAGDIFVAKTTTNQEIGMCHMMNQCRNESFSRESVISEMVAEPAVEFDCNSSEPISASPAGGTVNVWLQIRPSQIHNFLEHTPKHLLI